MIPAQIAPQLLSTWTAASAVAASRLSAVLFPAAGHQSASFASKAHDDGKYVYLPPGSSMKEPIYISTSDPVYFVDNGPKGVGQPSYKPRQHMKSYVPKAKQAIVTHLPSSMAEAESLKLAFTTKKQQQQDAQKEQKDKHEAATYVYLPPGSSMKEPMYISLSDPVYYVDNKGH